MTRVITNVPTEKLSQIFTDLKYEFPVAKIWATRNGNKWTVHYVYYE